MPRLRENARVLLQSQRTLAEAGRKTRTVSPAAEWLLSNFHLVEEQIREIREDLPPGFYRELPKLATGTHEGYARVYGLAWSFVAHTDSRIELDALRRFILAYQRVESLTIGELWALAISLRVVLVENLRRLAERIAARGVARERADAIADALLGMDGAPKPEPAAVLPDAGAGSLLAGLRGRSSPRGCASRIPRSRPRSSGSIGGSRAKGRRPRTSFTSSTRSRSPTTRRCATSSRACASSRPRTGPTSSKA